MLAKRSLVSIMLNSLATLLPLLYTLAIPLWLGMELTWNYNNMM
jgi:hypothetical protein